MKEKEIESMRKVFGELKGRIESLVKSPKVKSLQNRVIDIRKNAIDNNEELLQTARQSFKENDIDLFYTCWDPYHPKRFMGCEGDYPRLIVPRS